MKTKEKQYPELFSKLEAIFFLHDPIVINFGSNPDEYVLEVEGVLKRIPYENAQDDVHTMIYETFCSCFGMQLAGEKNSLCYRRMAKETCQECEKEWDQ